jgi:hypothetical protein
LVRLLDRALKLLQGFLASEAARPLLNTFAVLFEVGDLSPLKAAQGRVRASSRARDFVRFQ